MLTTILIRILQLMLSLSILVVIHEGGHFLFARLFKVRVEKFRLFFDPWFTPFKFKPKKSDTEYGIGWLPLGGYVTISGMIDESMNTEQMKQPVKPWEFRAKPAWQRLLIMAGGVLFNFILAIVIYTMILFAWGDSYYPLKDMYYGMKFNETAQNLGFEDGDILLRANDVPLTRYNGDMFRTIVEADAVTVLRHGNEIAIPIPADLSLITVSSERPMFAEILIPAVVDSVIAGYPAAKAQIQKGDKLICMNGKHLSSWNSFVQQLDELRFKYAVAPTEKDWQQVELEVMRGENLMTLDLRLDSTFTVGVVAPNLAEIYSEQHTQYNLIEAIPAGITHGCEVLGGYVSDLKYLFTKEGSKQVGGFASIANIFPALWDWHRFWEMSAFLSIILAFMNILPIPALDGGHILFLLYEMITRRKPSDKFLERAQMVGMILLLSLLIWANFNDILRYLF